MAYVDDPLSEDERREAEGASLPGGGGAPAASGGASRAPVSSGFQNLSSYFTANADQAGTQGSALASDLQGRAEGALRSDDPGTAMGTLGEIDAAATPGGLSTVLQADKGPDYTAGMAGLDSYLGTRGADPGAFEGLRGVYADRLKKVESPVARPGAMPTHPGDAPTLQGAGSVGTYARQLEEWQKAMQAFGESGKEYQGQRDEYEGWQQRRAENLGETYRPHTSPLRPPTPMSTPPAPSYGEPSYTPSREPGQEYLDELTEEERARRTG